MIALLTLLACSRVPFEPLVALDARPDVAVDRMCTESFDAAPADHQNIDCTVEGAAFGVTAVSVAPTSITVMAWNLERGHTLDEQILWLGSGEAPVPGILLLSEADRGCARTDGRYVAWDIAEALGMNMAYAVEFVEQSGSGTMVDTACEHGNALLSRFPMGNVSAVRHEAQMDIWFTPPGEREGEWATRLGGRIHIAADIDFGGGVINATSVHWASGSTAVEESQAVRVLQAEETLAAAQLSEFDAMVGGDTNAGFYSFDLTSGNANDGVTQAYFTEGWADSHDELAVEDRITSGPFVLDLLLGSPDRWSQPGVCEPEACDPLTDHRAVWATWTTR